MVSDTTRRRLLLGIGTGVTVGLAGCAGGDGGGDDGSTPATTADGGGGMDEETTTTEATTETEETTTESMEMASLRVAHLAPNAPNVDVYVDGDAALEDVPFGAVSDYLEAPAGERTVEITAAGDAETVVFSGPVEVAAGTAYTVAATGELGDDADQPFAPVVLEDDRSAPDGDTARLRLLHASPDAPAVDVTVEAGDTLFDGVSYGESGTVEVPANDYTVQVRGDTETNDGEVAADFDVSLNGGTGYTAFAVGYLTPDDEPADTGFDLVVAQDTGGM